MIALIALTVLAAALWGLVVGLKNLVSAIQSRENRGNHVVKSLFGFFVAGFLTYPVVLGPLVASASCASGVGLDVRERVDLSTTGYEFNWRDGKYRLASGYAGSSDSPEGRLLRHAIENVIDRRVSFIETSSIEAGGLHRISLGPESSRRCVQLDLFDISRDRLPPGRCLQIESVTEPQSKYLLETSWSFGRRDAIQRSVKLIERASERVVASYTSRRIPSARLDLGSGNSARRCPEDADRPDSPLYALPDYAMVSSKSNAVVAVKSEENNAPSQPGCKLPSLPEGIEVHSYRSYYGRSRTSIQIDNSGSSADENIVYVNRPGVPVALLLSSHDPVVWRIRQTHESRIVVVVVRSESGAAVTGARDGTPLLISAKGYSRMVNCSMREGEAARMQLISMGLTSDVKGDNQYASGREVIPFHVGAKIPENGYEEDNSITESRYALMDGIPAGNAGVDYLVRKGVARLLTEEDLLALRRKKVSMATGSGGREQEAMFMIGNSVILLRETELPDGAYQRQWIVPRGVPYPRPPFGHNLILKVDADCRTSPCKY